jgi:uridine kinase
LFADDINNDDTLIVPEIGRQSVSKTKNKLTTSLQNKCAKIQKISTKRKQKKQTEKFMSSFPEYSTTDFLHKYQQRLSRATNASLQQPNQHFSSFEDDTNDTISRLQALKVNFERKKQEYGSCQNPQPFIIGVAGGSASGKTTVCQEIVSNLSNKRVVIISQDSFYKSLGEEERKLAKENRYDFDHPNAFDYEAFEETVRTVKSGTNKTVEIPIYDFKTHSRVVGKTEKLPPADVIIVEGILIFFTKELRELMDMKIFVDTDADVRLARRIRRDIKERGRDLEGVLTQYETFVKPSFDDYIMPTKKYADIIIPRGGANRVAIDLLVQHIKIKLANINRGYGNRSGF